MSPFLMIHIAAGGVGLVSGAAALVAPKGGRVHRWAGLAYVPSMMLTGLFGAVVGFLGEVKMGGCIGLLSSYLVFTGWLTIRRREKRAGLVEMAGVAWALGVAGLMVMFGLQAQAMPGGELGGQPAEMHFVFAGVAVLAALSDLTVVLRGGVEGRQRVARHVWRMCVALLFAALSFFPGQPDIFVGVPELVLMAPPLGVLATMLAWLACIPFARRFRRAAG